MGYFVKGENIYILGKITEVDPEDSTRYRIKTDLAKFYVTEQKDVLQSNPAEVYTAPEFYSMIQTIANMSTEDLHICFGEDYDTINDVLNHGWSITELRVLFREWQYGNNIVVGDMVYYTSENIISGEPTIICSVIGVSEGDVPETATDNTYTIYDDRYDQIYTAKRSEIASARNYSKLVVGALSDLKEATKKARGNVR